MKELLGKVLLAGWIVLSLVGLSSLSLSHMAAMPKPDDGSRLERAMLALPRKPGQNLFVHVIYAGCSCTERLFAHLLQRGPFPGTDEVVLFIGEDAEKQRSARRAGFEFISMSPAALADRFGLEAAPILAAFDTADRLRYVGGYYNHPAALLPLDQRILRQVIDGASPPVLPVFGCAVTERLQGSVDPLGIVYRSR